jgi:ATP-dependent DNA helicase DinG
MKQLADAFRKKLADDQGTLESDTRNRLDNIAASLERRALMELQAWIDMLSGLNRGETPPDYVDWMAIERANGQSVDVGLYRHHLDPAKPFAASMRPHVQGMGISSATLLDNADETYQDWEKVARRTGMLHLNPNAETALLRSPFDYAKQTRVYILDDVNKRDANQVAGAYRALFTASDGGALGLFTAISRLRTIYDKIAAPLEEQDIALYAQHVDDIDTGTLVDMFRDDIDACLFGTDAVRDGVDVPGKSLRLIAFDRVPWPRPDILHKARRKAFGGKSYDEMLTRLKLKQAFGRLIRKADDKGVFVMLDSGFPSRLHNAFPPEVGIIKCGLSEAVQGIEEFLNS